MPVYTYTTLSASCASKAVPRREEAHCHVSAQVVAKYGLEKSQAQRDVDALMKGRQI
jgi:hypothetical protein